MPTLEDVKQEVNFDTVLAGIISREVRQPSQIDLPTLEVLIAKVRGHVNPKMIRQADRWQNGDQANAPASSQHGQIRFRPTQQFLALLRQLVIRQHGGAPDRPLSLRVERQRATQLKVEVEKGVAEIKVGRKKKRR